MTFAENLKALPGISHLQAIELVDAAGAVVATIENKPGQTGSLAVYNHLGQLYGAITAKLPAKAWNSMPSMRSMPGRTLASTPISTDCLNWRKGMACFG
jgi:hypothetical protein